MSRGRKSDMAEHVKEGVFRSKYLKKALANHDKVTEEAMDRACHYLAVAAGNLINTISPDVVVFGGGVVEATGNLIRDKVLAEIDRYCMTSIRPTVELKTAALGDDSNIYGSLAMIRDAEAEKKNSKSTKKAAAVKADAKAAARTTAVKSASKKTGEKSTAKKAAAKSGAKKTATKAASGKTTSKASGK